MYQRKLIEDYFLRERKVEGIERELKLEIISDKIVAVVGARRVGKTWYLLNLYQKLGGMYVNFADTVFKDLEINEFFEILKIFTEVKGTEPKNLFLDEVQDLKGWEVLLRSLLDRGFNIFVTGSSSKLLPRYIATQLRGRNITYLLFPFSFREFLRARGFEPKKFYTFEEEGKILKLLKEFLIDGAYPEVVIKGEKERLWKSYFDEIFYKDFVERHKIKSIEFGRFLIEYFLQNFSKEISLNRVYNYFKQRLKLSPKTLYQYVDKLTETLNIYFLENFSESVFVRRSWPRKIYIIDMGIANIISFSEDIGRRMENATFLELLRKKNEHPLLEIYCWKDYKNEVDFLVKEGLNIKQLIQVTYASSKEEIEKRELRALIKAYEIFKKDKPELLIITWDYEDEMKINEKIIKCVPLWKWLLDIR
jgi:predicted AAA+ superfamily ATPase